MLRPEIAKGKNNAKEPPTTDRIHRSKYSKSRFLGHTRRVSWQDDWIFAVCPVTRVVLHLPDRTVRVDVLYGVHVQYARTYGWPQPRSEQVDPSTSFDAHQKSWTYPILVPPDSLCKSVSCKGVHAKSMLICPWLLFLYGAEVRVRQRSNSPSVLALARLPSVHHRKYFDWFICGNRSMVQSTQ